MSIDREEGGVAQLPRRLGFFVRWRARSGLLPGEVSTAALVQTRRYRWTAWIGLPFVIVMIGFVVALPFSASTTDEPAVVANVLHLAAGSSSNGRFEVLLDDGRLLFFNRDSGVHAGDHVLVRHKGSGYGLGLVVNGVYVPSTADSNPGPLPVVFVAIYGGLALVFLLPYSVWGRRAYRQVKGDLGSPLVSARGRYVGSWVWRGLSNRLVTALRQRRLGHITGFPIAIEERPGEVTWFGAPVDLLTEVRDFENAIADGTREVVVSYHPHTHAIAKLDAVDGRASVDLQHLVDHLHPEAGLQLKVSRRRRKAHLPDF